MARYDLVQSILKRCEDSKDRVSIFMSNGFKMQGRVAMSDPYSLVLMEDGKIAKAISYNQISTINFPVAIFNALNKQETSADLVSPEEPFSIMRAMFRKCWENSKSVQVYMSNGFQMRGEVLADDAFSFVLLYGNVSNVASLIFFAQLSTIDFPVSNLNHVNDYRKPTPTQEKND